MTSAFGWEEHVREMPGEYLHPAYYDAILPPYTSGGRTDLDLLADYLSNHRSNRTVVELGCGSGRATQTILGSVDFDHALLVDRSEPMIQHTRSDIEQRFDLAADKLGYIVGDSIESLSAMRGVDLLVSLWNVSHSIHQHMFKMGRAAAEARIRTLLLDFLRNGLTGSAFVIHYDIQSDEQRLINPWRLDLWAEADSNYDASGQSPSKELLDSVLRSAALDRLVKFSCRRFVGDHIEFESKERALEVFLNFHMEGYYSRNTQKRDQVIRGLSEGFEQHESNGRVLIRPGWFVYEIDRL